MAVALLIDPPWTEAELAAQIRWRESHRCSECKRIGKHWPRCSQAPEWQQELYRHASELRKLRTAEPVVPHRNRDEVEQEIKDENLAIRAWRQRTQ